MLEQSPKFLNNLSERLKKNNILKVLTDKFENEFNLTPCFGAEIEFYSNINLNVLEMSQKLNLLVKAEKGNNQYEVEIPPSIDLTGYASVIDNCRKNLVHIASELSANFSFASKPFLGDYGSSIHFHFNFCENDQSILLKALDAFCHYMLPTFLVFMPTANDYLRIKEGFMAPVNVSWGINNRTVAIRMIKGYKPRIEHRVSSPLVDPYLVMVTLLKSVLKILTTANSIKALEPIFGNAAKNYDNLQNFPVSILEAIEVFDMSFFN